MVVVVALFGRAAAAPIILPGVFALNRTRGILVVVGELQPQRTQERKILKLVLTAIALLYI